MHDFISIKTDINGSIPSVTVKQFDSNSRFLHVTLSDGDLPEDYNRIFEMTGCAARLLISLGHDRYEYVDGEVADPEGGIVTFLLPGSVTQRAGSYTCEIRITEPSGSALISTKPFTLRVEDSISADGAIQATPQYSALENALMRVDRNEQRVNALASLADAGEIPAGTVESEITDARVGWDGTQYPSLGDAVRGQAGNAVSGSGVILNDSRFQNAFGGDFDNLPNNRVYPVHLIFESEQDAAAAHAPVTEPGGILVTFGRGANRAMGDMQMLISTNGTSSTGFVWQGEIWVREYWDVSRNRWNAWHRPATSADTDGILNELQNYLCGGGSFLNLARLATNFSGCFDNIPNNRIYPVNIDFSGADAISAGITALSAHAPLQKTGGTLLTFGRGASTQDSPHKNGDVQIFTTPDGTDWTGEILVREYWDGWNAWHGLTDSSRRVWKGLKVSVLGDSVSSYSGHSVGNAYYSSSKIPSVNSMWWGQLCKITGAEKLVVDAYASSCCAVASASWTSGITPAVDDTRCRALHTGSDASGNRVDPDIILIAMGLNDFQANVPLGDWDGHDELSSSDTATWRGAYANMLLKIHTEYPDALVFCLSPWFFVRGSSSVANVNTGGNTYQDFEDAMREVCNLLGGIYIDGSNFGFTRQNYSGSAFAIVESTADGSYFHPNATGQEILGQSIAAAVRDKAVGYVNWLKNRED